MLDELDSMVILFIGDDKMAIRNNAASNMQIFKKYIRYYKKNITDKRNNFTTEVLAHENNHKELR